jgi:hypothetical protein
MSDPARLGTSDAFRQASEKSVAGNGLVTNVREHGSRAALNARFDELRQDGRYGNLRLNQDEGRMELTYTIQDGTVESGPDTETPDPIWNLTPSDIEVPVAQCFDSTPDSLQTALDGFRRGVKMTGLTGEGAQHIHDLLWAGVEVAVRTRYIVEASYECGYGSVDRLTQQQLMDEGWGSVDRAVAQQATGGISAAPSWVKARLAKVPGYSATLKQFLVRAPTVSTVDARRKRIRVARQWYWSQGWSAALYGGDKAP